VRWAVRKVQSNEEGLQKANSALSRLLRRDIRNDLLLDCATAAAGVAVARSLHTVLHRLGGPRQATQGASPHAILVQAVSAASGTAVFLQVRRVLGMLGVHTGTGSPRSYLQLLLTDDAGLAHAEHQNTHRATAIALPNACEDADSSDDELGAGHEKVGSGSACVTGAAIHSSPHPLHAKAGV